MKSLYAAVHYYLVSHPTITQFHWKQNQTPLSSLSSLTLTLLTYLFLTFLLHRLNLPPLPSSLLRPISAVHSLLLLLLSLTLTLASSLSSLQNPPTHLFCFPLYTPPKGPTFFWAYIFHLSKLLEFIDTLLIILSGSGGKRRLSFLHVYHHAGVVVMCYLWLYTSQSLFPVALVTNCAVHVLMYGYYLLCAVGRRPRWKRAVTDCQIVQFLFGFAASVVMLWYHFAGEGCSGIWAWCFNAVFNASLLGLFVDFHGKNYARRKKEVEVEVEVEDGGEKKLD